MRHESKKKIMEAAFALFAKQGFESTSIAQIAKQAGVSKGLLYNYFQSKEDLLQQLVADAFAEGDHLMEDMIDPNPRVTLNNIITWFFREVRERPNHWKLMTELTLKVDKFEFVHQMASEKMGAYTHFMQNLLEQIGVEDPEGEARIIAALFDGIGIQYIIVRENYPLDELESFLINKYCK